MARRYKTDRQFPLGIELTNMRVRFGILIASATLVSLFVLYTLYSLQVVRGPLYVQRVRAQQAVGGLLAAERGGILFTDKQRRAIPAALNTDYPVVYAVPAEIEDPVEAAEQIAALLELDAATLLPRLQNKNDQYEALAIKANEAQVAAVEAAHITGVYITTTRGRLYPFNNLAAHVLGFVSHGDETALPEGQYGIEAYYNATLAGQPSAFSEDGDVTEGVSGTDIQLTIDQNVQVRAEEILHSIREQHGAVAGTIIVQDPQTGSIVAMASEPHFDPNEYGKSPLGTFINPAVQNLYEPGSVFKPITMAAALDGGVITPQTTYTDLGYFTADGKTIKNWDLKAHGTLTMTNVIEQSINTGTVFAEKKLGHKAFYEYLLKFGFKEPTGIDLPGETLGRLTPLEQHPRDINFATASYGQGVAVTPIRLITSVSAIASGGVLHDAYITEQGRTQQMRRVISERAAREVTDMMVSAVNKAEVARIPKYRVAGKTGTAFIPDFEKGGYTDKVINTYVGFAPACGVQSPAGCQARFTVLIKLDEPNNAPLAGTTVVPAFRELAEFLLNYYNVPPDDMN